MNLKYAIRRYCFILGILLSICNTVDAEIQNDTLPPLKRLFSYYMNHDTEINGIQTNTYLRFQFRTMKRNPTLLFVPSMYYVAKGQRNYVGETYGKMKFRSISDYDMYRQVLQTTIPHNRKTMTALFPYLTPNIYGVSIYGNMILSPFHASNKSFYNYRVSQASYDRTLITFTPRIVNTQLISGYALTDAAGRVIHTRFNGEQDMIRFRVNIDMGDSIRGHDVLPLSCETEAQFKFLGNDIRADMTVVYQCPITLDDSIHQRYDAALMDSIRPIPLTETEIRTYERWNRMQTEKNSSENSEKSKKTSFADRLTKTAWNILGDYMVNSMGAQSDKGSIKISPLMNPLYLSYSHSRGLAYKMNIGAHYNFSSQRGLSLAPDIGYNFKIHKFYFSSPLRYTYNALHDGWIELTWANGNRITNSSVLDKIKDEHRDIVNFPSLDLDYFNDEMWKLAWNTRLSQVWSIHTGTVFHRRTAVNKALMEQAGKPKQYKTFAPFLTLSCIPFKRGPVLTGNYERGLLHVLNSNTKYERWEFDASYKKKLRCLRSYNLRVGGGFYTNKSSDYFVDFENFHENYLPGGWQDDWTGDFQLLNSQWYNASYYYIRANASYESPMLLLSWMPFVGRYIESERFYGSTLQIEHTRPYFELGYGFTTRFFSLAVFGSFLNGDIREIGGKFTFELFKKW